ncbi:uncharacterized protein LOC116773544 [Danaus plexippus]|uniref:uncharacterized protein LOC116773544 n=1 Tax=Danaus plexippus TaxID=13037 RepID=UPI002AB0C106|nr:uncharacterized protein LOC116773544 [Danaus plexippus]
MKTARKSSNNIMKKYYQLILVVVCFISIVTLLIYRHEYYRLRYVLEVLNFFGKPGLSEVEFCGPGFNATMLSEILRNSSMEVRETPPLFQQIDENFYSYSSFLRSYNKYEKLEITEAHIINTIVIGKAHVQPRFRCNIWFENSSKPKAGRFSFKAASEIISDYQLYIFECSLSKNLGKPAGISFYVNDYNINPMYAPINKVIQVNTRRKVRERSSIKFVNNIEPAFCVIPNHVPIVSRDAFIEFLVFHHIMGVNYFTIYDGMISEDVIKRLNLFPSDITQWDIQFFPLNYPFVFAKSYKIVRSAIELDCLFRHYKYDKEESSKVSHVAVLSWDEFLVPRVHNSFKAVLDDFDPTRALRTYTVEPLLFCLNQNDDDNVEIGYPAIMKKTHYYNIPQNKVPIHVRNLETMTNFDDLFNLTTSIKKIPLELLGAHKYSVCRDWKTFSPGGYNETEMQVFQHKFEGAMIKYGQSLVSNKVYRLYTSGQIWEKNSIDNVRDML